MSRSSSFLGFLYGVLNRNRKRELLRGLWVHFSLEGSEVLVPRLYQVLGFEGLGSRCCIGLGFRVWGLGCRVQGLGFRVWGLGFGV